MVGIFSPIYPSGSLSVFLLLYPFIYLLGLETNRMFFTI